MDKQELADRLARRWQQSRGKAADILDDLIYKLWKESRNLKAQATTGDLPAASQAPVKKS